MRIQLPPLSYPLDAREPFISALALSRLASSGAKSALQEMHESHLANIALCEQLLD